MKRKSDIENARLALGLADTSAIDRVSGSHLALARGVTGTLFLVYWLFGSGVQIAHITFLVTSTAMAKIVGVIINYICARRGIDSDVGYTLHNIGRAADAMVWAMLSVAGILLFGFEVGLLVYIAAAVYNVIVFRAYRAVQESLYMTPSEKRSRAYSRTLTVAAGVIAAALYGLLVYYIIIEKSGTVFDRVLYCLSFAERLGVDPFTPFLLGRYRKAFDAA